MLFPMKGRGLLFHGSFRAVPSGLVLFRLETHTLSILLRSLEFGVMNRRLRSRPLKRVKRLVRVRFLARVSGSFRNGRRPVKTLILRFVKTVVPPQELLVRRQVPFLVILLLERISPRLMLLIRRFGRLIVFQNKFGGVTDLLFLMKRFRLVLV